MTDRLQDSELLSRRRFLQAGAAGLGSVVAWQLLDGRPARAAAAPSGPAAVPVALDTGWLFGPSLAGGTAADFDDSGLATVTLPHAVTPLSWREWDPGTWERPWLYRRHFDAPPGSQGMRVFVDFDAALTGATLTMNDQDLAGHVGGYLPFTAELTDELRPTGNVLAVVLDSGFNIDVPPNRPAPQMSRSVDFWQPGGIYRDVHLRVVPQVFLADVFAKPTQVLDAAQRAVEVALTLDAAVLPQGTVALTVDLRDGAGKVASTTIPVSIAATGQTTVHATLTGLDAITLWDIDNPHLYDVVASLSINDTVVHDYRTRIGFREASFTLDGFFLNGWRVKLFGVNRHQGFPFAGFAMPARVQRKDAEILRTKLNCNMVRCSHYPQSQAFLDACDELGLLVWEEIPGWGFFGDAAWQAAGERDVHDMIVRDRNHPSIVVWGAMPNEAGNHVPQYTAWNELAHSLDDSRPTGGDDFQFGAGASGFEFDVYSRHDYSHQIGPDGLQEPTLQPPVDAAGKPYLVCEAVGTLSGPARFYRRTDTQSVQQGQATAHARVHDIAYSDDRYCGLLAWSGIDYESGNGNNQFQGVKYTGVVDVFRVPKPGAAIYQAQIDPQVRPVIAPAFYWDFGPTSPVNQLGSAMICANLDRLEVYVAGAHFATVTPDTTSYGHLPHPPSFVDFAGVDGTSLPELRIDGYLGSTKVASQSFSSDPAGDRLQVSIDDTELIGDGSDATRVEFRAVDRFGQPRPYVQGDVTLSVDGPAALIGDNPFVFADTGAVGAVWLRTIRDTPGTVTVTARHPSLGSATATARIRQTTPGGPPAPYGTLQASASSLLAVPGQSLTISATFTNNGQPNLDSLTSGVQLPPGWTAQPTGATTFTRVNSGQQVSASWKVTVPADAQPGDLATITAAYTAHGERGVSAVIVRFVVPYPALAAAFNNVGITDSATRALAAMDGSGDSYDQAGLTAAGLAPGAILTQGDLSFTWPDVPAGQPDNVVVAGQVIAIPAGTEQVGLLAASVNTTSTVSSEYRYADGTSQPVTLTVSYWRDAQPSGDNQLVARVPTYRGNQLQGSGSVFYVPLPPPDASHHLLALALPSNTNVHVFALAVR